MILSRSDIESRLSADPGLVDPRGTKRVVVDHASITLHLHDQFTSYTEFPVEPFTPPATLATQTHTIDHQKGLVLAPGRAILACSEERVCMPLDLMGIIQTKGTIARAFLTAHLSDGQIDPGYTGRITFEIVNMGSFYIKLMPAMAIAQLFLVTLTSPVGKGYDGRYQGAERPTPMKEPK